MLRPLFLIFVLLLGFSQPATSENTLEKFQSQAAQSAKDASTLSQAQIAVSLVQQKFYPSADGTPAVWSLINTSGKPRVVVSSFDTTSSLTNWASTWGGTDYAVDKSGLAALKNTATLSNPNDEQDGYIGVANLSGLTSDQLTNYFGNTAARFPASANAFEPLRVVFKSITTSADGSKYLTTQVGAMNVDIPVPLPGGWYQEAYIKAVNAENYDEFGWSVAISGDTAVVGAFREDSNQSTITNGTLASTDNSLSGSGAAYVYTRSGGVWTQQAFLKASNVASQAFFGGNVSISGNTIVVGAHGEASNQTTITNGTLASSNQSIPNTGAAYVFKRTGTQWVQEAYLKAPNSEENDRFSLGDGHNGSISGDTIVVGAHYEDSGQTTITNGTTASADNSSVDSGAAYVFRRKGSTWNQEAYLKASNNGSADWFGYNVAISGDTIVVSAWSEDSSQTTITNGSTASANELAVDSGAAYVFKHSGSFWAQEAFLKASNAQAEDQFGWSVAISGDSIVVGGLLEDSNQTTITNGSTASANDLAVNSGAAYVFKRTGTQWVQEAYLKASNADANDQFGHAVGISGDTIVVGARWERSNQSTITNGPLASSDNSKPRSGAAYVYTRVGENWKQEAYLKAPNVDTDDYFARTVSVSGDTIILGARWEDSNQTTITNGMTASLNNSAPDSGAVYVFRRPEVSASPVITSVTPSTALCPGNSVVIFGSGFMKDATVKIGDQACVSKTTQGPNEIVCELPAQPNVIPGTPLSITVNNPNGNSNTLSNSFSCDGWYQEAYIKASNADSGDVFGRSISVSGDTVVVGANYEESAQTTITNGTSASTDNSAADAGAAYVYKRTGSAWVQEAYLKAPNAGSNDLFGTSVGISGNTIVVGARWEDSNQTTITNGPTANSDNTGTDSGAAYVFKRTGSNWAQEAYLKVSNNSVLLNFGYTAAVSGDWIVVGTWGDDNNQTTITNGINLSSGTALTDLNYGSAYVFKRTGSTWAQEAYLKAPNAGAGDLFSSEHISISGDTVVVGARLEDSNQTTITNAATASSDNSANDSGAAYVFKRNGSTWAQEAYLKASNAGVGDNFGSEVFVSGDTLVVGADEEDSNLTTITNGSTASSDNSANDSGAAYVFKRNGSTWAQEAYLKASNAKTGNGFGVSVSISGDTLVVGAHEEDSNLTTITNGSTASLDNSKGGSGAAYVFKRTGSTWAQEAYLKAPNADPEDFFGRYVSISSDTIALTAPWEDSNQTTITNGQTASPDNSKGNFTEQNGAGAVYVFRRPEKDATPDITSVTPTQAFCPGSNIVIFGSGFMKDASVAIDGAPCTSKTVQGPNEIVCETPRSSKPEGTPLTITVTNPNGKSDTFLDTSNGVRTTVLPGNTSDWIPSGITVTKGKPFSVSATGTIIFNGPLGTSSGPNGFNSSVQSCKTPGGESFFSVALLGKIGKTGTVFLIGSSYSTSSAPESGELYLIENDSGCSGDNSGSFNVTITAPKAFNCDLPDVPVITIQQQPTDQTADTNGSATFTVSAQVTGGATLQYQWQRSTDGGNIFNNITGATGSTLTLNGLTNVNDNNRYRVVLTSTQVNVQGLGLTAAAPLTSNSANLAVCVFSQATGGTTSDVVISGLKYRIHEFKQVGSTNFSVTESCQMQVLVVAGGGGGGGGYKGSGGGGAGGLIYNQGLRLPPGNYQITVGAGGASRARGGSSKIIGLNTNYTAIGGGQGGDGEDCCTTRAGGAGGSGGGGGLRLDAGVGGLGTNGQGNNGGDARWGNWMAGGGGGGAGAAGTPGGGSGSTIGGNGGAGLSVDIYGTAKFFAGGGGGQAEYYGLTGGTQGSGGTGGGGVGNGGAGAANTGGGGGGGGGVGGSGIVIIRYRIPN